MQVTTRFQSARLRVRAVADEASAVLDRHGMVKGALYFTAASLMLAAFQSSGGIGAIRGLNAITASFFRYVAGAFFISSIGLYYYRQRDDIRQRRGACWHKLQRLVGVEFPLQPWYDGTPPSILAPLRALPHIARQWAHSSALVARACRRIMLADLAMLWGLHRVLGLWRGKAPRVTFRQYFGKRHNLVAAEARLLDRQGQILRELLNLAHGVVKEVVRRMACRFPAVAVTFAAMAIVAELFLLHVGFMWPTQHRFLHVVRATTLMGMTAGNMKALDYISPAASTVVQFTVPAIVLVFSGVHNTWRRLTWNGDPSARPQWLKDVWPAPGLVYGAAVIIVAYLSIQSTLDAASAMGLIWALISAACTAVHQFVGRFDKEDPHTSLFCMTSLGAFVLLGAYALGYVPPIPAVSTVDTLWILGAGSGLGIFGSFAMHFFVKCGKVLGPDGKPIDVRRLTWLNITQVIAAAWLADLLGLRQLDQAYLDAAYQLCGVGAVTALWYWWIFRQKDTQVRATLHNWAAGFKLEWLGSMRTLFGLQANVRLYYGQGPLLEAAHAGRADQPDAADVIELPLTTRAERLLKTYAEEVTSPSAEQDKDCPVDALLVSHEVLQWLCRCRDAVDPTLPATLRQQLREEIEQALERMGPMSGTFAWRRYAMRSLRAAMQSCGTDVEQYDQHMLAWEARRLAAREVLSAPDASC